jgi:DNA-binding transcriptional MocR family regulator
LVHALGVPLAPAGDSETGGEGLNVWIHLPTGVDAVEVIERAAAAAATIISV